MTSNAARAASLALASALAGCQVATIRARVLDVTITVSANIDRSRDYLATPFGATPNAMPASRNAAKTRALISRRSSN